MKKILCLLSTLIPCFFAGAQAQMPQLSPADMQQMEQLEKQLMQEIEQYVSTLSPEEQAAFHQAVEEETRKIESMQPDELNKYIQDTFSGIEQQAPAAPKKEAPKVESKKEEVKKPAEVISKKQQDVLSLIESLTKTTGDYLRKISALPELIAKLPKWARQGRINHWPKEKSFDDVKKEIESFHQQLHKMVTKDQKTSKYIFLSDIVDNETLINNLNKLKSSLDNWEPHIILRTLEFETLKPESKKAIIQSTNAILEGLYVLALPRALDDIIVKYDPEAKKLREEAEKAEKQALEASKKGVRPAASRSYGTEARPTSRPRSYDSGYGRGGYGQAPYYGGGSQGQSAHSRQQTSPYRETGSYGTQGGGSMGGGRSGSGARGGFSRNNTDKSETGPAIKSTNIENGKKKGIGEEGKKSKQPVKSALPDQAQRRITAFGNSFESAITKLTTANLINPYNTIVSKQALELSSIDMGNRATEYLEEALGMIDLIATGASAQQRKIYAQHLNTVLMDNKNVLQEFMHDVEKISKQIDTLSPDKQYAYLGRNTINGVKEEIKIKVPKPFDILKLARILQEIQESINTLARGGTPQKQSVSQPANQELPQKKDMPTT